MDLAGVRARYERSLTREIVDELVRIEVVDRALALASKLFVAVIPLSIILSATVPGSESGSARTWSSRFSLTGPGPRPRVRCSPPAGRCAGRSASSGS